MSSRANVDVDYLNKLEELWRLVRAWKDARDQKAVGKFAETEAAIARHIETF